MFHVTSADQRPIAAELLFRAQRMEERAPGLHVLAAREFRYPVQQQEVRVVTEQFRTINLLEKFILRAYTEIVPPPSREELASVLGLDPVFIRNTFNDLISLQNISSTVENLYVTEEGRKTLALEKVSETSDTREWYFVQDLLCGITTFLPQSLDVVDNDLEDLSFYIKKDLTEFPSFDFELGELQGRLRDLGLSVHDPDKNCFVTKVEPAASPELAWKRIAVFVLYDMLKENTEQAITIQVQPEADAIQARPEPETICVLSEWLAAQVQEQGVSLKALCGLSEDAFVQEERPEEDNPEERIVEERLEEIRQQAITRLRLQVEGQTPAQEMSTVRQLRDVEIRPAFLKALEEAREQIIIFSPWINEQVVDDGFLSLMESLVQKGVHILIGYGIGRDEKREERPIPPALRQRLRAIETAEGTPGIIAEWLGNSHAKEIIIDRYIHFSGSHNWLSYRGDRFPRGETVYQVTIAAEVEKAYNHLARRFVEQAKILWTGVASADHRRALCILCYLGHEEEALEWIEHEKGYHLLSLWLTLAQQAVFAGHTDRILAPLQKVITLCYTVNELQDPLHSEIVAALRNVLLKMALTDNDLATIFINDNFSRLKQLGLSEIELP